MDHKDEKVQRGLVRRNNYPAIHGTGYGFWLAVPNTDGLIQFNTAKLRPYKSRSAKLMNDL
jgi:hypothetical protein